ncbi:MAG: methionyl-tRNA formyltransferase [Dehalococcoidia bacterium]|nr:methionyl-tRNA formyltransferase [Dehalococcoidia bacterium]
MHTIKAVFMGSPAFALLALQSLMSSQYDVSAVYTQPDKRTGRGQQLMSCPVKQYATAQGLRVMQPATFKDPQEVSVLADLQPDIIIVAAYGQILPDSVLSIPKYKCINIHPSLLPKYRGPSPVAAAILNGDIMTGVTIMLIEKKVDAGPILAQEEVPVAEDVTTDLLSEILAKAGAELLLRTIPSWTSGIIQPQIQDESRASYTRMETKEDGRLDWNLPAVQLWRKVRAYHPWPGCFTDWKGTRLKIVKAVPVQSAGSGKVGEIIVLPKGAEARVAVCTANGMLGLITVQPEGKKEMGVTDFMVGHREFAGSFLT